MLQHIDQNLDPGDKSSGLQRYLIWFVLLVVEDQPSDGAISFLAVLECVVYSPGSICSKLDEFLQHAFLDKYCR